MVDGVGRGRLVARGEVMWGSDWREDGQCLDQVLMDGSGGVDCMGEGKRGTLGSRRRRRWGTKDGGYGRCVRG